MGDYNSTESGYDHYVWEASGHDEYVYWGPNQGPVKSNSDNSRWYEKEQVDSSSSYTERGVFGPGGDEGKYNSNESYTDRWDYSGSGGSSGSYEDLITSRSSSDTDSYTGWDRYRYVVSDVGSFTDDGDAGYYSSEETWDGGATRDESRESTYSVTNPETTYVIGPGYSITTPASASGNRGSFRVCTESDYLATAVYHERYDEPAGTWASSYHYDAEENVDRPETSPCHGESSSWYTGPLGDRSSSFTSDLTDHKHDEWHETELVEGLSQFSPGENGTVPFWTHEELGTRTTTSEVHSGNIQGHCVETVTANGYTTTTTTDPSNEWTNAPPAIETTTGTAPTDEPTDPNLDYSGPNDVHYDALLAALDALAEQAANSTLTSASRAALVDAAIQSFTELDADENGQNGGAVYAQAEEAPAGTVPSPTERRFASPSRLTPEDRRRLRDGDAHRRGASSAQISPQEAADREAKIQRQQQVKEVRAALQSLWPKADHSKGSETDFAKEAKTIAEAYVDAVRGSVRKRLTRLWFQNDFRGGWMCYQWQTIVYNALKPVVETTKYFRIERVSELAEDSEGRFLAHNWVAITVAPGFPAHPLDSVPNSQATVYLDPWKGGGRPKAYVFVGKDKTKTGWEDGHPEHDFVATRSEGDKARPTGIWGYYRGMNGKPEYTRFNYPFFAWPWF